MKDSELIKHFDKAMEGFRGQAQTLESAIGAYVVGRRFGWKVLYLIHDKRTLKKFEAVLGLSFRNELQDYGDLAEKSVAFGLVQSVSNFWKAVSGEAKVKIKGKERLVRDSHIK